MYFEKQNFLSSLCGVHATNNLLGVSAFKQKDFNKICEQLLTMEVDANLSNHLFINPHKHIFGGDYDVNVLLKALQNLKFTSEWIDKRQKFDFRERQKPVTGYIINVQKPKRFYHSLTKLSNRHWVAVKQLDGQYYLLDSQNQKQTKIQDLNLYINKQLAKGSCVIQVKRSKQQVNTLIRIESNQQK